MQHRLLAYSIKLFLIALCIIPNAANAVRTKQVCRTRDVVERHAIQKPQIIVGKGMGIARQGLLQPKLNRRSEKLEADVQDTTVVEDGPYNPYQVGITNEQALVFNTALECLFTRTEIEQKASSSEEKLLADLLAAMGADPEADWEKSYLEGLRERSQKILRKHSLFDDN